MSEAERSILEFLGELQFDDGRTIARDTRLMEEGLIDSIGLVRLLQFVEERFGVSIPDEDVTPELFASPADLAAYVAARA